ncbi:MAG: nucleotidyltransferase [Cyanobacteria bacterium RYN_339]|nr:nucleotidyltransferase [Cyanobacteria bacterium RYN_339]
MPAFATMTAGLRDCVTRKPEQILFATACGALLYGFPRQGRYVELRGVHADPAASTREWRETQAEWQVEWTSHEVGKFVRLLQVNNGSAYEQLFSPYAVYETPALAELRELAQGMVSQQLVVHYHASFRRQLAAFLGQRELPGRHLLYLCRMALTGLHLAERGELLADLPLLARFHERVAVLRLLDELDQRPDVADAAPYLRELQALGEQLARRGNPAKLPEQVPGRDAAEAWLERMRER